MERTIIHNEASNRFEMEEEGLTAYIRYTAFDGGLDIVSTQVPAELEGRGIAATLTQFVLEYARSKRLIIIPTCSYTAVYLKRHPEYKDLVVL